MTWECGTLKHQVEVRKAMLRVMLKDGLTQDEVLEVLGERKLEDQQVG